MLEEEQNNNIKIKVVERSGVSLQSQVPGLKSPPQCKTDCIVHSNGGKGPCSYPNTMYRGQCLTCRDVGPSSEPLQGGGTRTIEGQDKRLCNSVYLGESGFSEYHRGLKHQEGMKRPNSNKSNDFARHKLQYHQGDDDTTRVKVDVVKTFARSMQRQVSEGVEIREVSCDILMNSKQDHYAPAVGHLVDIRQVDDREGW